MAEKTEEKTVTLTLDAQCVKQLKEMAEGMKSLSEDRDRNHYPTNNKIWCDSLKYWSDAILMTLTEVK